ncbi:MAG: 3-oxoadipate enol-lactonase [Myxococcota bacterium]
MEAAIGGTRLHAELDGAEAASLVVFSHSLGSHLGMWEPQVSGVGARFRVMRYDTRGHGASGVPQGPYTLEALAEDARALLDCLRIEKAHFVGISMGGMIGQLLALRHPERLHSLVLCDTTSEIPSSMHPMWDERIRITREQGMEPHVEPTMQRWFTEPFRREHPEAVDRIREMVRNTDPSGYIACCEAIKGLNVTDRLAEIRVPTLVVVGADDPGTTPDVARAIHERIHGSQLQIIEQAAHLCNVEQPEVFNRAIVSFMERHDPAR